MEKQDHPTNTSNITPANVSFNDSTHDATSPKTRTVEGDTYPISDNESTTDSASIIDANHVKLKENEALQGQLNHSLSQDSLTNDEQSKCKANNRHSANRSETASSTTNSKMNYKMSMIKSTTNVCRSLPLDEHIKLVKQKKEEAEVLRLQKFQEQLRKKEQKWQQQQLERVKKWLQLRNRDNDHRLQVEERRRKREEEAKAKIDEILRREKEREQHYQQRLNQNQKTSSVQQKADFLMTMSTDVVASRRALSSSRLRSNNHDNAQRSNVNSSPEENLAIHDDLVAASTSTNGECQRSITNKNRQHFNDTLRRLAKPKHTPMTQSVHISTKTTSNGMPISRSSHQLRSTAGPVSSNSMTHRRQFYSRPATVPTSTNESRTSPVDESSKFDQQLSHKLSSHRSMTNSKVPSSSTKPPTLSSASRSKPPSKPRSLMTTSHSSSSLSSSATLNKRQLNGVSSPTKSKPTADSQSLTSNPTEENLPVNEDLCSESTTVSIETNSKREQQLIDEQEYQRKLNQKIREAQQRLEIERQREEEQKRQLEIEEYEREQEQIRIAEEQRRAEHERLQRAIEERERENELKRQEEQRLQQQREELERRQAQEAERLLRERQEKARKEEEERNERKKRLDLIMRRTRQTSPTSKPEIIAHKLQPNGPEQPETIQPPTIISKSSIPHSISENHFPTSDNFLVNNDTTPSPTVAFDTSKFKSPLIQSLLNKARSTRSTDNLVQPNSTTAQTRMDNIVDSSATTRLSSQTDLSDDDHQENSRINKTTNGHSELHLSSSNNLNAYHERPMETAAAFQ